MSTAAPMPSSARTDQVATKPTRRVVDAPTRMFHWMFALCFVGAYVTADGERWRLLHVTLGYTLAGLFAFRVIYGLVGPRQARLSLLWRKLAGGPAWLQSMRSGTSGVNWRQGQNLLMALTVAALLVIVLPVTLSGYAIYNEWAGDWLEGLHEFFGEALLWVVLIHLAMIAGLSVLRRKNQALPMISGRVKGAGPDLVQRNQGWLALLVLVGVLSYWSWEWQQAPHGLLSGKAGSELRANGQHDDD